jgi:hypothetical protein
MALCGLLIKGTTISFAIVAHLTPASQRQLGEVRYERISEPVAQTYDRTRWAPEIHSLCSPLGHRIEDEPGQIPPATSPATPAAAETVGHHHTADGYRPGSLPLGAAGAIYT